MNVKLFTDQLPESSSSQAALQTSTQASGKQKRVMFLKERRTYPRLVIAWLWLETSHFLYPP